MRVAERLARALPTDEGWPPFLIVVDVGHTIELFADFTRAGKTYLPFPDPATFRITLDETKAMWPKLTEPEQQAKLKAVWTDPLSLDPSRRSAKVTRELADRLTELAKSLEASKSTPAQVAQFLMRCLFTKMSNCSRVTVSRRCWSDCEASRKTFPTWFPRCGGRWTRADSRPCWNRRCVGSMAGCLKTAKLCR